MNKHIILKTVDGFNIASIHTQANSQKLVLWLHGILGDKNENLGFFKDGAEYLYQKGIDSLRIDFRGHGKSSGTSLDFSIIGQMMDVESVFEYINNFYSKRKITVCIVGFSFGAPPAIFAATHYSDLVKKLILLSPVLSYKRTFLEPETQWGRSIINDYTMSEMKRTKQIYFRADFPVSFRLIEEMRIIHPEKILCELEQDIVIIHGSADSLVPVNISQQISEALSKIKFIQMHGMEHGYTDIHDAKGTSRKSKRNKKYIFDIICREC